VVTPLGAFLQGLLIDRQDHPQADHDQDQPGDDQQHRAAGQARQQRSGDRAGDAAQDRPGRGMGPGHASSVKIPWEALLGGNAAAQRVTTIKDRAEGRTAAGRLVDDLDLRPAGLEAARASHFRTGRLAWLGAPSTRPQFGVRYEDTR
jgi:hypothetical protein